MLCPLHFSSFIFLSLKESFCGTRKNVFCFTFRKRKYKFRILDNQIYDVTKCLSIKQEKTWEVNTVVNEIWQAYVILQKKKFY